MLMQFRAWSLATIGGVIGLALTIPNVLPKLAESIILGSSLGLIVAGPTSGLVISVTAKAKPSLKLTTERRLKELVSVRRKTQKLEYEKTLDRFDQMIEGVEKLELKPGVTAPEEFGTFVTSLTRQYPEWDAEGRLRTFVLMKKLGESLSIKNADAYLGMAYRTLVARGQEATELSQITLNGKVERIYREPEGKTAQHLAGTLLLMNRGNGMYAKEIVADAIHLWSDERFTKLLPDFKALRLMSASARQEVEDMIEKEMGKARRAGDAAAVYRSKEILEAILRSRKEPLLAVA